MFHVQRRPSLPPIQQQRSHFDSGFICTHPSGLFYSANVG